MTEIHFHSRPVSRRTVIKGAAATAAVIPVSQFLGGEVQAAGKVLRLGTQKQVKPAAPWTTSDGSLQILSAAGDYLAYQRCPRQYMLFERYGFAASRTQTMFFGSLVHATLEDLHHRMIAARESGCGRAASEGSWNISAQSLGAGLESTSISSDQNSPEPSSARTAAGRSVAWIRTRLKPMREA